MLLRIVDASPLEGFRVRVTLTNGEVREIDLQDRLQGSAFQKIRDDPSYFRTVSVEAGTLTWSNGVQLCPDDLVYSREEWEQLRRGQRELPETLEPLQDLLDEARELPELSGRRSSAAGAPDAPPALDDRDPTEQELAEVLRSTLAS